MLENNLDDSSESNGGKKRFFIRTTIYFGIGLAIAFVVMLIRDIVSGEDIFRKLCDGFFVSGILFICLSVLKVLAGQGEYDALGYMGSKLNFLKRGREYESYQSYRERKEQERKDKPRTGGMGAMLLAGGVLVLISLIFLIIYYA